MDVRVPISVVPLTCSGEVMSHLCTLISPSVRDGVSLGSWVGVKVALRLPSDPLVPCSHAFLLQPASWVSTSQPPGTSSAPAVRPTATLQRLLPRPATVTSATSGQLWIRRLLPAPVSTAPPRHTPSTHPAAGVNGQLGQVIAQQ